MRRVARLPVVARFPLLGLPSKLLGAVLAVELLALLLAAVDVTRFLDAAHDPARLWQIGALTAGLAAAGILQTEITMHVERFRRRVVLGNANIDLSSVWIFAAALLVPPIAATAAAVVIYLYRALRLRSVMPAPFQQVFTTATHILAIHAAAGMLAYVSPGLSDPLRGQFGVVAVLAAMLAFTVVNTCLIVGAVVMSSDKTVRDVLGHGDEVFLEIATLSLGGLVALATDAGPWLVVFALPPLVILHRALLVKQLQHAANTDGKTGLLTAAAWHEQAARQVERAAGEGQSVGVLMVDLDYFKRINDTYGHQAGDRVLRSVADVLRADVRSHDLVGRFGGEEFVMLLPHRDAAHYPHAELRRVAERIRAAVAALAIDVPTPDGPLTLTGITASIGGATFPDDGTHLLDLVGVADSALYAAKRGGRDQIRLGPHSAQRSAEQAGGPSDRRRASTARDG